MGGVGDEAWPGVGQYARKPAAKSAIKHSVTATNVFLMVFPVIVIPSFDRVHCVGLTIQQEKQASLFLYESSAD